VETVQYQKLTPMLLNEVQKQRRELQEQNQQQQEQIRKLEARLASVEALLSSKVPATATAGQ
jgi:cell division septum initiation protein DivIVA